MSHTFQDPPTLVFARSESTDSNGCVVCDDVSSSCPLCADDEECTQTYQTCNLCAKYTCSKKDDSSSKKSGPSIGGIVGGVIGAVAFLVLIAGILYYKFVYRKKHSISLDEEDVAMSEYDYDYEYEDGDSGSSGAGDKDVVSNPDAQTTTATTAGTAGVVGSNDSQQRQVRPQRPRVNRRLSSYESFTRPQRGRRGRGGKLRPRVHNSVARQGPYLDPNNPNRNSMATTVSTTNASNILPIAYIPGVTVRPTKNNTRSIYSYETDSIFSDLNTIENASIIGDVMRANNHNGTDPAQSSNTNNTMTAIKAQPRLVNVDVIEEEEEDMTDEENNNDTLINSQFDNSTEFKLEETLDEESDSDVDSDIGEITRATSVRRHKKAAESKEVLEPPQKEDDDDGRGSFILDVEMDGGDESPFTPDESSFKPDESPFKDPV